MLFAIVIAALAAGPGGPGAGPRPVTGAAVIDTALARMGGAEALARVERIRREMMTQWQRTTFDARPYPDQPSYEWHSDLRDYGSASWRNTRRFMANGSWNDITDIVQDSVAIRRSRGTWAPLNVAYVDERRELFAFAPERVLLLARAAQDLRALSDTVIAGAAHARVGATIDRYPTVLFFRRADGLLALARYRAAQPNDFGLVPWGEMEVEMWYSRWLKTPAGVALPMQWDVRRVGRPYKRMTVLFTAYDSVATPDSFAISDSLRQAFYATANRPMHDLPLDSARVVEQSFAAFNTFGAPAGAVKLGNQWVLLESGQAPLSVQRAAEWIRANDAGAGIAAAFVTLPTPSNGGVTWLAAQGIPVRYGPGAGPFLTTILRNHHQAATGVTPVTRGQWFHIGGDSLWAEPVDLPDAGGALLLYLPRLRWVYSAIAAAPLQSEYVLGRLRARGWPVERVGSLRAVTTPAPASAMR